MGKARWRGLSSDGNTIVIERFRGEFRTANLAGDAQRLKSGVVIDVETTGLDHGRDSVIEVGLRRFRFDEISGALVAIDGAYSGLQDPGRPIDPEIVSLTGLTDDMLRGRTIDWSQVAQALEGADYVIAHNAAFDRPFIDARVPVSRRCLWACSHKQIDWKSRGFGVGKLEILSAYHGFFTDAHRAQHDVDALLHLLSLPDDATGLTYLAELTRNACQPVLKIQAFGAPFEVKDLLKRRGYGWDSHLRVWHKSVSEEHWPAERAWLEQQVYKDAFGGAVRKIAPEERFKAG